MRWNWFIVACGVAVVMFSFAIAVMAGAEQAKQDAIVNVAR